MENQQQFQNQMASKPMLSEQKVKKTSSLALLMSFVVLIVAIVAGALGYYLGKTQKTFSFESIQPQQVVQITSTPQMENTACTREAKICPDGSSVGRTGPNCEFAACPGQSPDSLPVGDKTCGQGYKLSDTEAFTMCVPEAFDVATYDKTELGLIASYRKSSSQATLAVYDNFIGGWGANPCSKTEEVLFLGKKAQQIIFSENLSNSEPGDPNARCGRPLEIFVSGEKWSLGLNGAGEEVVLQDFNKARDSLTLK